MTKETGFMEKVPTNGVSAQGKDENGGILLQLEGKAAWFDCTFLKDTQKRYLVIDLVSHTANSLAFRLDVYSRREPTPVGKPVFDMQTGILPGVKQRVVIDLAWLDGKILFPEAAPGQLKITCHGRRVDREEISQILLIMLPRDEDALITLIGARLAGRYPSIPQSTTVPEGVKLVDEFGQSALKDWPGKIKDEKDLKKKLKAAAKKGKKAVYPFENWSEYGGCLDRKLTEGTGFFSKIKADGRWWLVDPSGYAFFSVGPDCTCIRSDCRVDGMEQFLTWLPEEDDPAFGGLFGSRFRHAGSGKLRRKPKLFSYEQANLMRAFGDDWRENWERMVERQLKAAGMNTLGNWSDQSLFGRISIPYVTSLERFPDTKKHIFRDFPDVLSPEYRKNARECAKTLAGRRDDPWMIGYFLRNEPAWAFVDNLVVADEVLYCPERTVCKEELIRRIKERYESVEALNRAWNLSLESFDDLYESRENLSFSSEEASSFLRAFSAELIREYVRVPAEACREADGNHMILGMRWAWISDPAIVSGWECFDVFSINCYAFDPTAAIENVVKLGVDLPVMIGEFHFGALDAGPLSTGLKAVADQADRGRAIRYYIERAAAHPAGVGCHYFQYSDQFALGRFDGENYNIGLFDICLQPYEEIMSRIRECAEGIYDVAAGEKEPTQDKAEQRCVIAF